MVIGILPEIAIVFAEKTANFMAFSSVFRKVIKFLVELIEAFHNIPSSNGVMSMIMSIIKLIVCEVFHVTIISLIHKKRLPREPLHFSIVSNIR